MVETFRNNGEESVLNLFKLKTYLLVQLVSLQMHIADIIIYVLYSVLTIFDTKNVLF